MKSAILNQSGFRIAEVKTPEICATEVLVNVTHCGVCSGDLHLYQVKDTEVQQPLSLGHEVIGVVAETGSQVTSLAKGDLVTAVDGVGGYSQQFVAPESFLSKVSDVTPLPLQMGEPIACCVHAVNRLSLTPDMKVAIVGCGFMGLVCQKIIHEMGCTDIVAFDLQDYRQQMALKLGARQALDPRDFLITDADEGEFDVVVEAAGVENALTFCSDIIAHHGQMLIVGYHQGATTNHQDKTANQAGMRNVNMQRWNYKAIDVLNGHVRRMHEKFDAMQQGLEMCQQGKLDISPLLKTYSLDDIEKAFKDLSDPSQQMFKAVIEMAET